LTDAERMIEEIVDATIAVLQADENIAAEVREWHKVNGLVTLPCTTVSVGCDDIDLAEYDRNRDEAMVHLKIFAGITDIDPERGELAIQRLALMLRGALVAEHSLKGAAATSFVRRIEFVYADDAEDLHGAVLSFDVKCYALRRKTVPAPPVEKLNVETEGS